MRARLLAPPADVVVPALGALGQALLAAAIACTVACGSARHPAASETTRCDGCHGAGALGAPPPSFAGATSAQDPRVGAHAAHLGSDLAHPAVSCDDCHVVPRNVGDPGHMSPADLVVFGARARAGGATPSWDRATGTCAGTACHAQPGATAPAPRWVDTGALAGERCVHCHGAPPPRPHPVWSACDRCHGGGTPTSPGVVPGPTHLSGAVDAVRFHPAGWIRRGAHGAAALAGDASCRPCHGPDLMSAASPLSCAGCHGAGGVSCGSCHGAPPATGAHARHHDGGGTPAYGAATVLADDGPAGAGYRFGCGQCHPVDDARHLDGKVDVDLSPTGAPAGSLKARNGPGAAYVKNPGEPVGRCTEVACHSSGHSPPTFVDTPRWDASGLACDGCHGNPPRYATSGPDGARPNSHLYPYPGTTSAAGHFGGFPAFGHGDRHGGATTASAVVTCQSCHFDTVDPAATGPSGFYWLDTTASFSLPDAAGPDCAGCHAATSPALVRKGAARPVAHVNGRRDVVFDPRTSVAATPGYAWPLGPPPLFPYWVRPAGLTVSRADVVDDQATQTVSANLAAATYDAATRTCSNVSCHLSQTAVRWGTPPVDATIYPSCQCWRCHAELFGGPPPPGTCP